MSGGSAGTGYLKAEFPGQERNLSPRTFLYEEDHGLFRIIAKDSVMDFTGGAVFILVAVPAIFFLLVWVAVTVARLLYPEKPLPLDPDPAGRSKLKKSLGGTQVSAREIRTRQQHLVGFGEGETGSGSESIPTSWKDDLWARRN